ncbi:MAG TPA: hypothetical protein VFF14_01395 [Candidatus Deferrimicrobium sp.]|nr:hypothetical protein [Candidatus Deferrimicrobium sp.]
MRHVFANPVEDEDDFICRFRKGELCEPKNTKCGLTKNSQTCWSYEQIEEMELKRELPMCGNCPKKAAGKGCDKVGYCTVY